MNEQLTNLLGYCRANGRVCPKPQSWDALYQQLLEIQVAGNARRPALPLILGGWSYSSDDEKRERLAEHIKYADQNGALDAVERFLCGLEEAEWHHEGPSEPTGDARANIGYAGPNHRLPGMGDQIHGSSHS